MPSLYRSSLLVVVMAFAGCVIVSSDTITPPGADAGTDAGPRPPRDAGPEADVPMLPPPLTREEATRGLLASIGTNVALPIYRELAIRAAALETAAVAHAEMGGGDPRLSPARGEWIALMDMVERAELLQLGPGGDAVPEILGGRGLRDAMYNFPTNRCFVDVALQRRTYEDETALAAEPVYARGLGAIEYQLFVEGTAHGCDPGAMTRVDDAEWDALGEDGIWQRRAESVAAHARLVRRAADQLLAAWTPEGDDFAGQLVRAGAGESVYPSSQAALNAIYWAMFYVDRAVKDMKLGIPTGRNELCGAASCPGLLESRWAGRSSEHLAANLATLQSIYLGASEGTEAIGFDDLLRAIGQDALAAEMSAAIAEALRLARALMPVDEASFAMQEAALEALFDAVRNVTTLLKVDFASVLSFTAPPGAGEDND